MRDLQPKRPEELDPLAIDMLERLQTYPEEARNVVLGGAFALSHYLYYRSTYDVDAWWRQQSTPADQDATTARLRSIAQSVAEDNGLAFKERPRATSEVVSLELFNGNRQTFSIQIAPRSLELEPPNVEGSPWKPIPIETLRENVAGKLNALVSRGAPRDFSDINALVRNDVMTVNEGWALWQVKNPTLDLDSAKAQVLKRLESIELRRPLETVEPELREAVAASRRWVREELARPSFGLDERFQRSVTESEQLLDEGVADEGVADEIDFDEGLEP